MTHTPVLHNLIACVLLIPLVLAPCARSERSAQKPEDEPLTSAEIAAAQQFGQTLSIAEWLGPMAPVALSPFFGITCLSGLSLFGGSWLSPGNPLVGASSPLHNPLIFWTFLSMTVVTSVPRLTKVSKPFAQAIDQVEAWSGIVTMLVIRVILSFRTEQIESAVPLAQLGIVSISADALMMVVAAINIFIINAVKFFFEVLIWLTPVPFLDAIFEFCNKTICAALMFVYVWSPVAAMAINVALFILAMLTFGWVHRREIFFRTILFDAFRASWISQSPAATLVVFPSSAVGPIKARSRCLLCRSSDGWTLTWEPWFRKSVSVTFPDDCCLILQQGLITNEIIVASPATRLTFSRLYNHALNDLAIRMKLTLSERQVAMQSHRQEFA